MDVEEHDEQSAYSGPRPGLPFPIAWSSPTVDDPLEPSNRARAMVTVLPPDILKLVVDALAGDCSTQDLFFCGYAHRALLEHTRPHLFSTLAVGTKRSLDEHMDVLKVIVPHARTLHILHPHRLRSEQPVKSRNPFAELGQIGGASLTKLLAELMPFKPSRLSGIHISKAFASSWVSGLEMVASSLMEQIQFIRIDDLCLSHYNDLADLMALFPSVKTVASYSSSFIGKWDSSTPSQPSAHQLISWSWISPSHGRYSDYVSGLPWLRVTNSADSIRELRVSILCSEDTVILAPFLHSARRLDLLQISLERMEDQGLIARLESANGAELDQPLSNASVRLIIIRVTVEDLARCTSIVSRMSFPSAARLYWEIDGDYDEDLDHPSILAQLEAIPVAVAFPQLQYVQIWFIKSRKMAGREPPVVELTTAAEVGFADAMQRGAKVDIVFSQSPCPVASVRR